MKWSDPWRDTIPLLTGAKPRRAERPGEQFELPEPPEQVEQPEQPRRSPRTQLVVLWCRVRLWIVSRIGGDCLPQSSPQSVSRQAQDPA